jgi:NADH-ubiquinone oxidoreductase chain 2
MINPTAMGLSSCFILLGTSLLYVNSGTTSMDGLYVLNNVSDGNESIVELTS